MLSFCWEKVLEPFVELQSLWIQIGWRNCATLFENKQKTCQWLSAWLHIWFALRNLIQLPIRNEVHSEYKCHNVVQRELIFLVGCQTLVWKDWRGRLVLNWGVVVTPWNNGLFTEVNTFVWWNLFVDSCWFDPLISSDKTLETLFTSFLPLNHWTKRENSSSFTSSSSFGKRNTSATGKTLQFSVHSGGKTNRFSRRFINISPADEQRSCERIFWFSELLTDIERKMGSWTTRAFSSVWVWSLQFSASKNKSAFANLYSNGAVPCR